MAETHSDIKETSSTPAADSTPAQNDDSLPAKEQIQSEDENETPKELTQPFTSTTSLDQGPKPPDGGWGWFVVVGAMLGHLLIVGSARGFGIFYVALIEKFQQSAAATSLVPSLFNFLRMASGPVVSWLCDRYTVRKVVIVGGLIFSAGCVASAFATDLVYLIITFGVIAALGAGLIFTSMFVILSQYFDKNKGKAMAFATLGSGVGTVIMAQLVTVLLAEWGYYGAMLIVGGLMLNNCVAGALFRPLTSKKKMPEAVNIDLDDKPKPSKCTSFQMGLKSRMSLMKNTTFMFHCLTVMSMPFSLNLPLVFIPPLIKEYDYPDHRSKAALLISCMSLSDMGGRFIFGFIFDIKYVRPYRRPLHTCLGIAMGLAVALIPVTKNITILGIICAVWGFIESGFHSQRATIQSTFISKKQMSNSVGFMILFQGIGNITCASLGGVMTDALGSYKYCFLFGGSVMMFFCSLFLLEYFVMKFLQKKKEKMSQSQNSTA